MSTRIRAQARHPRRRRQALAAHAQGGCRERRRAVREYIASDAADAPRGVIVKDAPIKVAGENFGAEPDEVSVKFVYADGAEISGVVSAASGGLVTVAWPSALDTLAAGTKVSLTVARTVDGETYVSPEAKAVIG